jgi:MFS superfamily sulfate permease-like transporter
LTFLSVVFLDVDIGLIIGIGVSIISVVINDQFFKLKSVSYRPYSENDLTKLDFANQKILKIESSIYFANCKAVKKKLLKAAGFNSMDDLFKAQNNVIASNGATKENENGVANNQIKLEKTSEKNSKSKLIIDFSAVNYLDTNGIKMILDVVETLKKAGVFVYLCSPQGNIIKLFKT